MNSQGANDSSDNLPAIDRWLPVYKFYLGAAVAFSAIGIATIVFSGFGDFRYLQREPFTLFRFLVLPLILNIAQVGLFVFAFKSLDRIDEKWVRTLHLSINGVAVAMGLFAFLNSFGYLDGIWSLWFARTIVQICNVAVFPIGDLIPWRILWSRFPSTGEEQHTVMLVVRFTITTIALVPAVFFYIRWNGLRDVVLVRPEAKVVQVVQDDATNIVSVGNWLVTLLLVSIPLVNIVALLWWTFDDRTPINKSNFAKASLIFFAATTFLYVFIIFVSIIG